MFNQASPIPKGIGRKLRRARNVVKKWSQLHERFGAGVWTEEERLVQDAVNQGRYERAAALILADKLRKS